MMKRFSAFLLGLLVAASAAATPTPPTDMIRATTDQMRELIRKNHDAYKKDPANFYKAVDEVLVPHFDTRYIAQIILARNWRTATSEQRERFQTAFKNMLVHNYADELLDDYDSVDLDYKPARIDDDKVNATVDVTITRKNGKPPVTVSFKLHLVGDQWQIFDVIVENVSLVLNYRTQVGSEIKRTSLDDVIARMEKGELIKPSKPDTDTQPAQPATSRSRS
jgi:phospholipid transport system substrate-binding protein